MDERSDVEKIDEVILPGFRFHPTDEELVGFYLKRKVQQKPLSIELIRQLNIYKYDPWDLPKLATTGEKEWYFYCPRDRKYRNSARPNRVTGAGFWKATGTDRPIYSSEGTKCIGLKKSLVFYKGRAAKGIKTDWMMHEFRLPSVTDTSLPKRPLDKNIPINDSWAICRIFKKTNSMAQRAISQSWVSPLPETTTDSDIFSVSCTTDAGSTIQYSSNSTMQQQHQTTPPANYPTLDNNNNNHYNKPTNLINSFKTSPLVIPSTEIPTGFMFSTGEALKPSAADVAAMLLNLPPTIFEDVNRNSTSIDFGQQQQLQQCCNSFTVDLPHEMNGDLSVVGREIMCMRKNMGATSSRQPNNVRVATSACSTFPYNMCPSVSDAWRSNATTPWDSPSCPSEVSATYSSKFAALD